MTARALQRSYDRTTLRTAKVPTVYRRTADIQPENCRQPPFNVANGLFPDLDGPEWPRFTLAHREVQELSATVKGAREVFFTARGTAHFITALEAFQAVNI